MRKHAPWIVVAVLALLGAGWWFGSPWYALYQIREAARARDVAALSDYVDYPAVVFDLLQRNRRALAKKGIPGQDQTEAARATAEIREVGQSLTTPGRLLAVLQAGASGDDSYGMRFADMELRHADFDEFKLVQKNGKGGEFVFQRHGLGWKLSAVHLPAR